MHEQERNERYPSKFQVNVFYLFFCLAVFKIRLVIDTDKRFGRCKEKAEGVDRFLLA